MDSSASDSSTVLRSRGLRHEAASERASKSGFAPASPAGRAGLDGQTLPARIAPENTRRISPRSLGWELEHPLASGWLAVLAGGSRGTGGKARGTESLPMLRFRPPWPVRGGGGTGGGLCMELLLLLPSIGYLPAIDEAPCRALALDPGFRRENRCSASKPSVLTAARKVAAGLCALARASLACSSASSCSSSNSSSSRSRRYLSESHASSADDPGGEAC
mmetsp:Transcript_3833/g.10188  ORF Transcript_3833/g.10188 Transcript_3833/m.10188 type:complete len:220 (+) Transcript_3833:344-1003(+)